MPEPSPSLHLNNAMSQQLAQQARDCAARADMSLLAGAVLALSGVLAHETLWACAGLATLSFICMLGAGIAHGRSARYHELSRAFL